MGKYIQCAENYICATLLYLFSIFSQAYYVIIDRGVSVIRHGRDVVYGLNTSEKRFLFQLMKTMKLPVEKWYDIQMVIHSVTSTSDVSLAR